MGFKMFDFEEKFWCGVVWRFGVVLEYFILKWVIDFLVVFVCGVGVDLVMICFFWVLKN